LKDVHIRLHLLRSPTQIKLGSSHVSTLNQRCTPKEKNQTKRSTDDLPFVLSKKREENPDKSLSQKQTKDHVPGEKLRRVEVLVLAVGCRLLAVGCWLLVAVAGCFFLN